MPPSFLYFYSVKNHCPYFVLCAMQIWLIDSLCITHIVIHVWVQGPMQEGEHPAVLHTLLSHEINGLNLLTVKVLVYQLYGELGLICERCMI